MKILDRYILVSFVASLGSATVVMIGLYLTMHLFSHVQDFRDAEKAFNANGISLTGGLLRYYLVHIPEMVVFFGPYAILLAGMYTLYQLNQNNELVPMYAVGVSRLRVAAPIFLAAAVASLGLMTVKQKVIPDLARQMVWYHQLMKGQSRWVHQQLPIFQDSQQNVFNCGEWDAENLEMRNVWIDTPGGQAFHFNALRWSGKPESGVWTTTAPSEPAGFDPADGTDLSPSEIELEERTRSRMSFNELRRLTAKRRDRKDLEVLMHSHISYALSPLCLLLLGLPLVITNRKKNVFANIGLCIFLSLLYFSASMVLLRMGAEGTVVNPLLGAWLPVIVFGTVGIVMFESSGS